MAKVRIERRGVKRRAQKPVVLIVTEGSKTEPKYFRSFRTRDSNIDIHVVGSGEYLLHFQYTTAFLKDYDAVASLLKAYIPDYNKAKAVSEQLLPFMSQAIQNADRVEKYHAANGCIDLCNVEVNPITTIHRLVTDLCTS